MSLGVRERELSNKTFDSSQKSIKSCQFHLPPAWIFFISPSISTKSNRSWQRAVKWGSRGKTRAKCTWLQFINRHKIAFWRNKNCADQLTGVLGTLFMPHNSRFLFVSLNLCFTLCCYCCCCCLLEHKTFAIFHWRECKISIFA